MRKVPRGRGVVPVAVVGVAVLVGAVGLTAVPAVAATPVSGLQSVQTVVGPDGSVRQITSNLVARSRSGQGRTSSVGVDPAVWGGRLPVRVQTAWSHDGKSGSDLASLKGKSGRFTVQVSVEDTAVSPHEVSYDADGSSHTSYALVGSPLTVVASADLGAGSSVGQIVSGGSDAATNGVASQGPDGHALVQYATVLAPPQAPGAATFTLVENTHHFTVPTFDIVAQPGIVSQLSFPGLVQQAVSGGQTASGRVQAQAIGVISTVDTTLGSVLKTLGGLEQRLSGAAGTLGTQTIADLKAGTASLSSQLDQVQKAMGSSARGIGASLTAGDTSVTAAVQQQMTALRGLLVGDAQDPASQTVPAVAVPAGACQAPVYKTTPGKALNVRQQVLMVGSWVTALADADASCAPAVSAQIAAAVGQTSQTAASCTASRSTSLVCDLRESQQTIQQAQSQLESGFRQQLDQAYRPGAIAALQTDFAALEDGLGNVALAADGDGRADGSLNTAVGTLQEDMQTLQSAYTAAQQAYGQSSTGAIMQDVAGIQTVAKARVAALTALEAQSPPSAITQALSQVCQVPQDASDAGVPADVQQWAGQVSQACTPAGGGQGLAAQVSAYTTAVTQGLSAWQKVQTQADTAASDVQALQTQLTAVGKALTAAGPGSVAGDVAQVVQAASAQGGSTGQVARAVDRLWAFTSGHVSGTPGSPVVPPLTGVNGTDPQSTPACPASGSAAPATPGQPVNAIAQDVFLLGCNAKNLDGMVDGAFGSLSSTLNSLSGTSGTAADGSLQHAAATAAASGQALAQQLGTLLTGYGQDMASAQSQAAGASIRSLDAAASGLSDSGARIDRGVNTAFTQAVTQITSSLGQSATNIGAADTLLQQNFHNLLQGLDGGNGSGGLVGILGTSVGATQASQSTLSGQADSDGAFSAVQQLGLSGLARQAAALQASVSSSMAPFAVSYPAGSHVTPVFSYRVGGA